MNRRTVLAAAWSAPVIVAATAAPAAAASTVPFPVTNVCQDGRVTFDSDRKNTNSDHVTMYNHTSGQVILGAHVLTSAQVRISAVEVRGGGVAVGFIVADSPNRASGRLVIPAGAELTVYVVTDKKDAEAHLFLDCGDDFLFKSVQAVAS